MSPFNLVPLFLLSIVFNFNIVSGDPGCPTPSCFKSSYPIQGLCASALIPLKKNGEVNYEIIPKYVNTLYEAGIKCIIVGADDTGSIDYGVDIRIKLVSAFQKAGKSCGLKILPEVGGQPLTESIKMARAVRDMGITTVASLPLIYYKTNSTAVNAEYICLLGEKADVNVLYYDNPRQSGVRQYMGKLWSEAAKMCPDRFAGMITSLLHGMEVIASNNVTSRQSLIMYEWLLTSSAYAYCMDGTSGAQINIFPKETLEIEKNIKDGNYAIATDLQFKTNAMLVKLYSVLSVDADDATTFNYVIPFYRYLAGKRLNIDFGHPSFPQKPLTMQQKRRIDQILENYNLI